MRGTPSEDAGGPVWLGVDLGTQSVRALAVTGDGRVLGRGCVPLAGTRRAERHEQLPGDWWDASAAAIRSAVRKLGARARISGLAVCGTSGTVLLTDGRGVPLTPGLMYDDGRAAYQARRAREAGAGAIQPSWALAKLMWLLADGAYDSARVCHQADFVVGRLLGRVTATDSSHALKTGYDVGAEAWPREAFERLGLDGLELPEVVRPGTVLGEVGGEGAAATGLPAGIPVYAGMTDGCAAQLASGALGVGDWNSVLGTTLVVKGVTAQPLADPAGVVYNHRSPEGTWLPGGASSAGAGALSAAFPGADLSRLDELAAGREPSTALAYPLVSRGERFPFLAPDARAFVVGVPRDEADHYAALLQGVAFAERLCLAYVRSLGAPVDGAISFTGGATRSPYWNQLRCDVLGRPVVVPEQAEPALGMAVLAAYGAGGGARRLAPVAGAMVRIGARLEPRTGVGDALSVRFRDFVDELESRGWLPEATAAHAREHG